MLVGKFAHVELSNSNEDQLCLVLSRAKWSYKKVRGFEVWTW